MTKKWISVKEDLPQKGSTVIAMTKGKDPVRPIFYNENGVWQAGFCSVHVSHWMPLPEPPIIEQESDESVVENWMRNIFNISVTPYGVETLINLVPDLAERIRKEKGAS